ncbi:MAG: AAA family ATPase [Candidatus Altiarchaeota archaeon]
MIEDIFDTELADRPIFKDLTVLSPHYVPDELPHRERESREISRILAPILRQEKIQNIFIYGKTGTGKTSVVRYVTNRLEDVASDPTKNKKGIKIKSIYTNCKIHSSHYQVLIQVLENDYFTQGILKDSPFIGRTDFRLTGLTPGDLYDRLLRVTKNNNLQLIIVLDEIDTVKNLDELVYALTRINDELSQGQVAIIGISNKYGFKDKLDPRSKSTLCERELVFKPYNASQLTTILKQRVKLGLKRNCIKDSELELIAAISAKTNGDARYALRLLQRAGEIAESKKETKIIDKDVRLAAKKVEEDLMAEVVSSLPEHQQVVLYAITETIIGGQRQKKLSGLNQDTLTSGEVYEKYDQVCKHISRKPRTLRWFREYLNDLEMLGLVSLTVSGKGVRGNTTLILLGYDPKEIKNIVTASLGLKGQR